MTLPSCPANCVVKHEYEKSCEFRHIQCPFIPCPEKISFRSLSDHLWASHQLLQFPTSVHESSFKYGEKTFAQHFAARPFCFTFQEKQFILEICRKHDTGLWHFWIFLVGSPWESNFFSCKIEISAKHNREEIVYKGPVLSIDEPFKDVFKKAESLVIPDAVFRRFCNPETMSVSYKINVMSLEYQSYEDVYAYAQEIELFNNPIKAETKSEERSQIPATRKVSLTPMGDNAASIATGITHPCSNGNGVPNKNGKIIYPDSHKLFVGNLFSECKDHLLEVFREFGEIADVLFFANALGNKKSPFYAFVIFKSEHSVDRVLMNKPIILKNGQTVVVQAKIDAPGTTYMKVPEPSSGVARFQNNLNQFKKK